MTQSPDTTCKSILMIAEVLCKKRALVHLCSTCWGKTYLTILHFPYLCRPVCVFITPRNSLMCIHLHKEGFMFCSPTIISISISLWMILLLLTQTDHVLYWQSPQELLLCCFLLHIALMDEPHGHWMHTLTTVWPALFTDVFPIDLNSDDASVTVPTETPATASLMPRMPQ